MDILAALKRRRELFLDKHAGKDAHRFSAVTLSLHKAIALLVSKYLPQKRVLDVGCGHGALKLEIEKYGGDYYSLDISERGAHVPDYICSVEEMTPVADAQFDAVTCFEVLEHVPHPWRAVKEAKRVLRPGGVVLVTAPHLSRYHELPHDYYRYTEHGLRALFEAESFEVVSVQRLGGTVFVYTSPVKLFSIGGILGNTSRLLTNFKTE